MSDTPLWKRHGWEPKWRNGRQINDPRQELRAIAEEARAWPRRDDWVAVPVKLLLTVVDVRECSVQRTFDFDEDGPITWKTTPAICRKPEGHEGSHSNGYYLWSDDADRVAFLPS